MGEKLQSFSRIISNVMCISVLCGMENDRTSCTQIHTFGEMFSLYFYFEEARRRGKGLYLGWAVEVGEVVDANFQSFFYLSTINHHSKSFPVGTSISAFYNRYIISTIMKV